MEHLELIKCCLIDINQRLAVDGEQWVLSLCLDKFMRREFTESKYQPERGVKVE